MSKPIQEHTTADIMAAQVGIYNLLGYLIYKLTGEHARAELPSGDKIAPSIHKVSGQVVSASEGPASPAGRPPAMPKRGDIANANRAGVPAREVQHFTLHMNYIYDPPTGRRLFPLHIVAGEPFQIDVSEDLIILKHEHWSLRGRGRTLVEAEIDLIENARDDAAYFCNHPVESMTNRAQALRDFILRVL